MYIPIPLATRVHASSQIIKAIPLQKSHTYKDKDGNIYTLSLLKVIAYLKGFSSADTIALITNGGVLGNEAQITTPSFQLQESGTYLLMLDNEEKKNQDKVFVIANPNLKQYKLIADAQGSLKYNNGKYYDLLVEAPLNEVDMLAKFENITNQKVIQPNGAAYEPINYNAPTNFKTNAISSFSPNPIKAGTVLVGERLTINGSGFLAARGNGTVQFTNADDGGATFITPSIASDYISWSDVEIVVRVPSNAGTGSINVVNNSGTVFLSGSALTVEYSHIDVKSASIGFGTITGQRFLYRNLNGSGGYSFKYNSTSGFSDSLLAKRAFERAASSWRCGIGMNWDIASPFATTLENANDNENVVMYDVTLPMGVVGVADSRYLAGGITSVCDLYNTVWWLEEIDVRFPKIPFGSFTWNYTTALASPSEFDFESVAVHELGHAAGLGHRIEFGDVMHYAIANNTTVRNPAPEEIAGGLMRMNYSTVASCFNPPTSGTPMIGISVGCILNFKWINTYSNILANSTAKLTWAANENLGGIVFKIEKSNDGINFYNLQNNVKSNLNELIFLDDTYNNGICYYRLCYLNNAGQLMFSPIIKVSFNKVKFNIITNNNNWQIISSEKFYAKLFNAQGQLLYSQNLNLGNNELDNFKLAKGIYFLQFGNENIKLIKK